MLLREEVDLSSFVSRLVFYRLCSHCSLCSVGILGFELFDFSAQFCCNFSLETVLMREEVDLGSLVNHLVFCSLCRVGV